MLNLTPYELSVDTLDVHAVSLHKNRVMYVFCLIREKDKSCMLIYIYIFFFWGGGGSGGDSLFKEINILHFNMGLDLVGKK